jgi:hypothetical protein
VFLSVADTTRLRVFRAEDAPSPVLS